MGPIDFTPLIWFGMFLGLVLAAVGYGVFELIVYLVHHLHWI